MSTSNIIYVQELMCFCSFSPTIPYITKKVRKESGCSSLFPFGGELVILFVFICPFYFICTLVLYKLGCRKTDAVLSGIQLHLNVMNYWRLALQSIFQPKLNFTFTEPVSFSTGLDNGAPRNTIQITMRPLASATIMTETTFWKQILHLFLMKIFFSSAKLRNG